MLLPRLGDRLQAKAAAAEHRTRSRQQSSSKEQELHAGVRLQEPSSQTAGPPTRELRTAPCPGLGTCQVLDASP